MVTASSAVFFLFVLFFCTLIKLAKEVGRSQQWTSLDATWKQSEMFWCTSCPPDE